jgi:hypothetical protein
MHCGKLLSMSNQKKTRHLAGFSYCARAIYRSGSFQIARCQFATLGDDLKTDTLTFGQCGHTGALDGTYVHENVLVSAFRCNEPETFGGIKKLYSSDRHIQPPYQMIHAQIGRGNEQSG